MRKSALVLQVFAELKHALGPDVPDGDVLRLANALLRAYVHTQEDEGPRLRATAFLPFISEEVDAAMADGGWRVLDFESRRGLGIVDADYDTYERLPFRARFLMESV